MLGLKIINSQNKPARYDREEEDVGNKRNLIRTKRDRFYQFNAPLEKIPNRKERKNKKAKGKIVKVKIGYLLSLKIHKFSN